MKFKITVFLFMMSFTLFTFFLVIADVPGKTWMQFASPEEAGFSAEKLNFAKQQFEQSEAAGVLVIYKGNVLVSWGETARRFRCASVRKSFMSAMYGIYSGKGKIDINKTLAELKIDDVNSLTDMEKQARVIDLLRARSGVYHPSAFSPRNMASNLPERGSHAPGTFWYYNNWDFNTLLTIFEQETGQKFFQAFERDIADVIQMEDFRLWDTFYRYEDLSKHAAYIFRMTARDMARFGLLCLNKGQWNGRQIIPEAWIEESTQAFSTDLGRFSDRGGYGYLWWVSEIKGQPIYYASGSGGQRICVLPESDLVFVHVVNTYDNNNVGQEQIISLLGAILDAKEGTEKAKPALVHYRPFSKDGPTIVKLNPQVLAKYNGSYKHRFLDELGIQAESDHLILTTGIGKFRMYPVSETQFFNEDIRTPVFFQKAETEAQKNTSVTVMNENRKAEKVIFYY